MKHRMYFILLGIGLGICLATLAIYISFFDFFTDNEPYLRKQIERLGYTIVQVGENTYDYSRNRSWYHSHTSEIEVIYFEIVVGRSTNEIALAFEEEN